MKLDYSKLTPAEEASNLAMFRRAFMSKPSVIQQLLWEQRANLLPRALYEKILADSPFDKREPK